MTNTGTAKHVQKILLFTLVGRQNFAIGTLKIRKLFLIAKLIHCSANIPQY